MVKRLCQAEMAVDEVIDIAGRATIEAVSTLSAQQTSGPRHPIQRCRNHRIRNLPDYLPKDRHDDVRAAMKSALQRPTDKGVARLKRLAQWFEHEYPSAATSLLEGLEEMFTINRLDLPSDLRRCLGTTNIIESPNAGIGQRTGGVTRWRDGRMVLRWTAAALLSVEKRMRRIMGYRQLWILEAKLREIETPQAVARAPESAQNPQVQ